MGTGESSLPLPLLRKQSLVREACHADNVLQEGYAARHNAEEEDGSAAEDEGANGEREDPMQGLEGLDVAGPRLQ